MSFSHFLTKFHVPVAFSRFYGLPSFHANQTPRSNLHLIGHTPTHFQQQNSFWTRFSAQEGPQVCHYFSKEVSFVFETLLVECNILYTFKNIDQQNQLFCWWFLKKGLQKLRRRTNLFILNCHWFFSFVAKLDWLNSDKNSTK